MNISNVAWRGATAAVLFASLFVFLVEVFSDLFGAGMWFYGSLSSLVGLVVVGALAVIGVCFIRGLAKVPWYYLLALLVAVIICDFSLPASTIAATVWTALVVIVCPSIIGGAIALIAARIWQKKGWSEIRLPVWVGGVALTILLAVGSWLLGPGQMDDSVVRYNNTLIEPLSLPNPSLVGKLPVKMFYYGSGKDYYRQNYAEKADIKTEPVDGSPFIKGWSGWTGWLRSYYWGFDAESLPLNGRVWYPEGLGPFPLVLLVHGNHTMSDFSDVGYNYLGSLLASQGFIAVSVDENFLNTSFFDTWSSFDEVPSRGWLLLKHLALWRTWNETPGNPFYHKVDMENIGLIGHSRGGEAIVTADAFNALPYFPEDGNVPFDFNFSIKALAAIAPKDGQYLPSGNSTPLKNVNYFVMHGSHDGDVRSFEGTKTFSRLIFDDGKYWFKAALYIVGANHGQFNEIWDRSDASLPDSLFLNLVPLLPNTEQHKIAEVYLAAFLRATLKGEKEYIPLFWDSRLGKTWLPDTLFVNQFEDSKTAFIYAGKGDLNITKGTLPGVQIAQKDLTLWRQQKVSLKWGDRLDNAIFAGWTDSTGSLELSLPSPMPFVLTQNSVLAFSLADARENPDKSDGPYVPWKGLIDFTVEVTDRAGIKASLPLSHIAFLYPQVQTEVMKADFLDTVDNSEVVFQTFRLPLQDFLDVNPSLDINALHFIRFVFDRTPYGVVIFDRIGFGLK